MYFFGARPCSNVSPAPCPIFVSLKRKYICHFTSEENDRNSSPLSGCSSSKLRAFLLDNFLLSTQQVDCRIHFIIKIVYTTKMLTESPSDDTRVQPSCATRVYFNEASTRNEATDKAIPPTGGKTPLEAAMAAANTYVETLHKKLRPFLTDLIRQVLKDASVSHFKSEKLKEINATSEYVPAICGTIGMKLQAVSEVTKSSGFQALEDELTEAIQATRRDWATRFVLPVFDMNVKALRRRFQLSFCRLLSSAAKGFIAQVGIEGYDAIVAIMDLLSIHGDEVLAPLNVTTHDFLVLLKEAAGTTIIPSPTGDHSLSEVLHKINGTSPLEDRGQEDGGLTTTNAARAAAAAAAITVNEQLTAAKSAVAQATSHLELMRELVNQARVIADEATRTRMAAHQTLAAARRERAAAIDPIDVAASDESQCIAELHAADMDTAAAAKSQLATGAQALFEAATRTHADAVHTLNALRERTTNANAPDDAEGSVRTYGTTATLRSMSSLSTTPTVAMTTATVTPGFIIPRNDFRRAASLLHHETNAAIREIVTITADEDVPRKITNSTTPMIDRQAAVISALKTLLDNGIVTPMRVFHARVVDNAQDRRITKATVEPQLEHAAARIAAVVEAERPANRPTLKGLIHDDVDKKTEELYRRIQSLEAKLGETKNALKRKTATSGDTATPKRKKAKNERGDATKSNKTPGTAVAPSAVIPNKNTTWKRTATKTPTTPPVKNPPTTPAGNDNASTAASKKPRKKATGRKSSGKGRGKPTAARN